MMNEEKQGEELVKEQAAIRAQHAADLEHLLKNTHPSLWGTISLGDKSDGTTQALSDYSATILTQQVDILKEWHDNLSQQFDSLQEEHKQLKTDLEQLRLQVLADATPETPVTELPTPTPVVIENGVTVLPAPAPEKELTVADLQIGTPLQERTTL